MIKLMENVKEITENDKKISFSNIFFYVSVLKFLGAPLEEQSSATTFLIAIWW